MYTSIKMSIISVTISSSPVLITLNFFSNCYECDDSLSCENTVDNN